MKKISKFLLAIFVIIAFTINSYAQVVVNVTGESNTTPNLSSTYTSIANALTALNAVTAMTGPVTLTLQAGAETAPREGFVLGSATLNPVLSATNTITINASGTVTINAAVGTSLPTSASPDGMFVINGADYVTLNGITFTDGNTTNPGSMEFGVALFKRTAGDGANFITIQNCIFNMQRVNNASSTAPLVEGSVGIAVYNSTMAAATTALTPTNGGTLATNGTNSNNRFYTNTINGGNYGIAIIGFAATAGVGPSPSSGSFLGDINNDIGGNSLSTGNTLNNFGGGGTVVSAGIRVNNQWSVNISYNTLNNNTGAGVNHTGTFRGIFAQAGVSGNANINFNNITLHGGGTTTILTAIENAIGITPLGNTVNVNNNTITGSYTTATTGGYNGINVPAAPAFLNINNNTISNLSYSTAAIAGSGTINGIVTSTSNAVTVLNANNNTVTGITRTGSTGGTTNGINISAGIAGMIVNTNGNTVSNISISGTGTGSIIYGIVVPTSTVTVNNNTVSLLSCIKTTGTGEINGIRSFASSANETYNNNTVHSITHNGTGTVIGMHLNTAAGVRTARGNTIHTITGAGTTITGMQNSASTPSVSHNKIYNITSTSTGAPIVSGILVTSVSAGTANIFNNIIGDLKAPNASGADVIRGINITSTTASVGINVYYNSIFLNASSAGTNFGTSGIFHTANAAAATSTLDLRNNIIFNISTPNGTGLTVALRRSAVALDNYATTSNNNLFFVGSGTNRFIYNDATSSFQTLAAFQSVIGQRESVSKSENVQFQSIVPSHADFLKIDLVTPTQVESGGQAIAAIIDDFFGNRRFNDPVYTGTGIAPDIGAFEGEMTPEDLTPPMISYTPLVNTSLSDERVLIATISDPSGVPQSGSGLPVLYWQHNDGTWQSVVATHISGNSYQFNFGAGPVLGDSVMYYIVAQDASPNINIGAFPNAGIATFTSDPPAADAPPTNPSKYFIIPSLSGIVTVGTGGDYPTLTGVGGLFAVINSRVLLGSVTANIISNIAEPGTHALNQWIEEGVGGYTLTIQPSAAAMRTISGSPATGLGLIRLNGADRVIIDGSFGGSGRFLTFEASASTTVNVAAIQLISLGTNAGATNNTIRNTIITGNSNTVVSAFGIHIGGTAITTSGTGANNNNITIENNTIQRAFYGIYAVGATTIGMNNNLSIIGNTIGSSTVSLEIANRGIHVGNAQNVLVQQNTVFGFRNNSTSIQTTGIDFSTNVLNSRITRNHIFDLFYTGTSNRAGQGIAVTTVADANVTIDNNVIHTMRGHGSATALNNSWGIMIMAGSQINVYYNSYSISETFGNSNTNIHGGIYIASGTSLLDIRNNIVRSAGAFGVFYNIYSLAAASAFSNLNNNNYFIVSPVPANTTYHIGFLTSARTTLADWRLAVPGFELNSFSFDPMFTSNTNLTINSGTNPIPLESGAAVIAGINTDFNGTTRPAPGAINGGGTAPDIGAYEFDGALAVPMFYTSSTTTQTNTGLVMTNTTNNQIIGIEVVVGGQIGTLTANQFNFSTNGTTSLTDLTNAKLWFTGPSSSFATTTQVGATITDFTGGIFTITPNTSLAPGTNYFWLTYDLPTTAVANNFIDAECLSIVLSSGTFTPTITAPVGSRKILGTLSGDYTVGTNGDFVNLSNAFSAINAVGLSGNTTLNIISNITETSIATLNQWAETPPSSNYTLLIQPQGGARTITGNLTTIIRLNGADRVTIDGRLNNEGNFLTFSNSSSSTSAVFNLISLGADAGATNNTIRNLNIITGSNAATTYGVHIGSSTLGSSAADNDNNSVLNNVFTVASDAIFAMGTASTTAGGLDNLLIEGNVITCSTTVAAIGIRVGNALNSTISRNDVDIRQSATGAPVGISIENGVNNTLVARNIVRRSEYTAASGYGGRGITVGTGLTSSNITLANNVIFGVAGDNWTSFGNSSSMGIGIGVLGNTSTIATTTGGVNLYYNSVNMFGTFNRTSATLTTALFVGSASTALDIRNNIFVNTMNNTGSASAKSFAIYSLAANTAFANINRNNYFVSGTQGVLGFLSSDRTTIVDWRTASGLDANSISANPLFNTNTNLIPQPGSPLLNAGTPILGFETDFTNASRSVTTPTIGAYENAFDLAAPVISYTPLTKTISIANRTLDNVILTDASGINFTPGLAPRIYFKRFSNNNAFVGNTSADNGWKWVETTSSSSPASFTIDYSLLFGGSANFGDTIQYFVVAQDLSSLTNVGINSGNFAAPQTSVNLTSAAFPITGTINNFVIANLISGTFTVGTGGQYPNLTGATGLFQYINDNALSGSLVVNILSNLTEDGTHALNEIFEAGVGNYTITIQPADGTEKIISGSATNGLIRFNGADRVTIDGRFGGSGQFLRFRNTHTTSPTFTFINAASNNTLTHLNIEGSNTSTTSGVILFSTTNTTLGNNNNIISNSNISDGSAGFPTNIIFASGTTTSTAHYNTGNTIQNNNIFNFHHASSGPVGINISSGNTHWTISENSFYQTASRDVATTTNAILISSAHNNRNIITNNFIGGTAPLAGGTPYTITSSANIVRPIQLTVSATDSTVVSGNIIRNFNVTTTSTSTAMSMISLVTGKFECFNNVIGDTAAYSIEFTMSGSASVLTGILAGTGTPNRINISNNIIAGIRLNLSGTPTTQPNLRGINASVSTWAAGAEYIITGNKIGSWNMPHSITSNAAQWVTGIMLFAGNATNIVPVNVSNNLISNISNTLATSTSPVVGIQQQGSGSDPSYFGLYSNTNNIVRQLSAAGTGSVIGINHLANQNPGQIIRGNQVFELSSLNTGAAAVSVTGITASGPTTGNNIVEGNLVHTLNANTSVPSNIRGLSVSAGNWLVMNNKIRLGVGNTSSNNILALDKTSATACRIFNNSLFVGGEGVSDGTGFSTAFRRGTTATADSVFNNIFVNQRSNTATGGKHYAIITNNNSLNLNNNIYFVSGNGTLLGSNDGGATDRLTFSNWRAFTGLDGNSAHSNPNFVNPTALIPNLNIQSPTPIEGNGIFLAAVTHDFNGQLRSALTPTDIGAVAGNFTGFDIIPPSITFTPIVNSLAIVPISLSASITDPSGVDFTTNRPRLYYKKSSDNNTFVGNTSIDNGWKFVETASSSTPVVFNVDYTLLTGGGVVPGDTIQYFVVAQDINGNVALANGGFNNIPTSVALTVDAFPIIGNISNYRILNELSGIVQVGTTGQFPSLTGTDGLFAAINSRVITGNVTAEIVSDLTETGAVTLNQWAEHGTGNYTLTIRPGDGTVRTISGSVAGGLIVLNGADRVTVDGRFNNAGNFLTFSNTSTSTSAVFALISQGVAADINNITIRNTTISAGTLGSSTASTSGVFIGGSTLYSSGHFSNISILNNNIRRAWYGVFANAEVTASNGNGFVVSNNTLTATAADAIGNTGIYIQGVNGATVANNNIANIDGSLAESDRGIWLASGTTNTTVSGNIINNLVNTNTTGSPIGINVTTAAANSNIVVSQNTITQLASPSTTAVSGITVSGATGGINISRNMINNVKNSHSGGWMANGIQLASSITTANIIVFNNLIYDVTGYGWDGASFNGYGILINSGGGYGIYYNSVHMNTNQTLVTGRPAAFNVTSSVTTAGSIDLRNNVFVSTQTLGTERYAIYSGAAATVFSSINHNSYFTTGANLGFLSTNQATLADWRNATTQDAQSISSNPLFTAATDLRPLSNTPLRNAGTHIPAVTTDIEGTTRNATTPTIGAYEVFLPLVYVSSTTTQTNTTPVNASATNAEIIGIEVVVGGEVGTLNSTQFNFSTNGTTTIADLSNAKLWYTGTSSTFATTTQVGATITDFTGGVFSVAATTNLAIGTNYFWLTYDISPNAPSNNTVDAECLSIVLSSGTVTPTVTAPIGNRIIIGASKSLDINVFLEGPYNAGNANMNTALLAANVIPLSQPYSVAPWLYAGTETVTVIPANVVDWVLVELRDAATADAATELTKLAGWPRAMFLRNDGKLIGLDGNLPSIGNPTIVNNLYIVIRHRNHIDIMSAAGITLTGSNYTYNFTDAVTKAHGGSLGYKQIATGVFGMVTGDADVDGSVFLTDRTRWAVDFGNINVYMISDFDMDANVFLTDLTRWATNFGTSNLVKSQNIQIPFKSQVPVSQ